MRAIEGGQTDQSKPGIFAITVSFVIVAVALSIIVFAVFALSGFVVGIYTRILVVFFDFAWHLIPNI